MRFALNINVPADGIKNTLNIATVELYDSLSVSSGTKPSRLATLMFARQTAKEQMVFEGCTIAGPISKSDQLTVRKLAKAFNGLNGTPTPTPLALVRALLENQAVQVAWDAQQKRFRCVGTMKDGEDVYEAAGTSIQVEAKDEDMAVRLAKRAVTERMQDKPEEAEKLVKFFTGGCKVKKLVSNKLPDYVKVESLAQAGEEKLAAQPIKVSTAKDDDKE